MKWELAEEQPSAQGSGGEYSPVLYPRSNENRGQSDDNNKGGASRNDSLAADRVSNTTGYGQSPRSTQDVDYEVGTYPEGVNVNGTDDIGGVDEGDGASR